MRGARSRGLGGGLGDGVWRRARTGIWRVAWGLGFGPAAADGFEVPQVPEQGMPNVRLAPSRGCSHRRPQCRRPGDECERRAPHSGSRRGPVT